MEKRKLKPGEGIIEGVENLKPGEGVQVGDTKYEYGADLSTEGQKIIDPGTGRIVSLRVFTFKINSEKIKEFKMVDKQKVFNSNAKQIATILWGDGLMPFDGASPHVIIDIKRGFYKIIVPCEAKKGVIFSEKDRNVRPLHEQLAKGKLEKPSSN